MKKLLATLMVMTVFIPVQSVNAQTHNEQRQEKIDAAQKKVSEIEKELDKLQKDFAIKREKLAQEKGVSTVISNLADTLERNANYYRSKGERTFTTPVEYTGEKVEVQPFVENYVPNNQKIAEYFLEYIKELRRINGIPFSNIRITPDAMAYAKLRAEEMTKNDDMSHDTVHHVTPAGKRPYTENVDTLYVKESVNKYGGAKSDKEFAYMRVLRYFSDYFNVKTNRESIYGHRTALLVPNNAELGVATTDKYSSMNFVNHSGPQDNGYAAYTSEKNVQGVYEYTYNGKKLKFLPKITFHYNRKITLSEKVIDVYVDAYLKDEKQKIEEMRVSLEEAKKALEIAIKIKTQDQINQDYIQLGVLAVFVGSMWIVIKKRISKQMVNVEEAK